MKKLFLVFALLCVLALVAAAAGIILSSGSLFSPQKVLVVRLGGALPELSSPQFLPLGSGSSSTGLSELYLALRAARSDDKVSGLGVVFDRPSFGIAKAQEIRRQFQQFRDAGKFVECYMDSVGEAGNGTLAYFLASACDELRVAPAGDVNLLGLYSEGLFVRGALDKLKIQPEMLSVGAYKSGAEMYTREDRSPAAKEAIDLLLDRYFDLIVEAIAEDRDLETDRVRALIDQAPLSAQEALEAGLVDELVFPDQFRDRLEELAGGAELQSIASYSFQQPSSSKAIALVVAQGTIIRGRGGAQPFSSEQLLGSRDFNEMLRSVAENPRIAAVVLRIDSPGGSALASDLMLREVVRLAEEKPVIVSMSDVAASGGYYIASKADAIIAESATLTGSIGVYGGKLVTGTFQEELLGLTHDPLARGANAGMYSAVTPFSPTQRERAQALMDRVYETFLGHVSEGRTMERADVHTVAQGRVWTGTDAETRGLVDHLGGLDLAIAKAAEAAEMGDPNSLRLNVYPSPPSFFEWVSQQKNPGLPAEIQQLLSVFETRQKGVLQLPPELHRLASPF